MVYYSRTQAVPGTLLHHEEYSIVTHRQHKIHLIDTLRDMDSCWRVQITHIEEHHITAHTDDRITSTEVADEL